MNTIQTCSVTQHGDNEHIALFSILTLLYHAQTKFTDARSLSGAVLYEISTDQCRNYGSFAL